jgi:hypothetical protein
LPRHASPDLHSQAHRADRRPARRRGDGESLYEAAILGVAELGKDAWTDVIAPGPQIEIQVRQPATTHSVTVAQLRRWCEGVTISPEETLRKRRSREMLT